MPQLISKVQYKKSEKGEFHHIAKRNLDETIALVLAYPWDTERSLASVELTCPSVTVEHPDGTYLKAGPYFSGKFSLYYLAANKKVYLKTVSTLEEVCTWIKKYVEQGGSMQFSETYGFMLHPSGHFKTNLFEYMVNVRSALRYYSFLFLIIPVIFFMSLARFMERPGSFNLLAPLWVLLIFLVLFSPLIFLYFNHLAADKYKYLKLSRGHDDFIFGSRENKTVYAKQDISRIDAYGMYESKSLWRGAEVFVITFQNGEQIKFSSLLIMGYILRSKFPGQEITNNRTHFPTL